MSMSFGDLRARMNMSLGDRSDLMNMSLERMFRPKTGTSGE